MSKDKEWTPKLPPFCRCVICREAVTEGDSFLASKPRRGGGLNVAHVKCWEKEQQELKETSKDANT